MIHRRKREKIYNGINGKTFGKEGRQEMTLYQYGEFVAYDQYKWQLAYKQQQVLPVEWRTLVYKHKGTAEEEAQYPEYFKFSRAMYDRWIGMDAQDKFRPILNVYKTDEYLYVFYTVWNGRVYMPSEKVRYNNLPKLNNCNIGTAIQNGLINQVAEYMQFEVVEMIWTTKQLYANKTQ